jgi:hypothetical protein
MASVWVYWILGTYDSHTDTLALTTGLLRSSESLGSSLSFAIGSSADMSLLTNLLIAAAVFWASVPTSTWASWMVPDLPASTSTDLTEEVDDERQILIPK